jgi:hypothetical protein
MKERMKRLLGLVFILLLLAKGLPALSPLFSFTKNTLLTELQTEAEPEQEKQKGNSKAIETESVEDFFEKIHFCHADFSILIGSSRYMTHTAHSLQWVHLDIPTPPPDQA